MGKLTRLKDWVGLREAADHLSEILDERVKQSDIVELGLSQKCVISVYFGEGVVGRHAPIDRYSEDRMANFLSEEPNKKDCFIGSGVWDLTLHGIEKQNLKNYLSALKQLKVPNSVPDSKGIVLRNETHYCQLLEPYDANPEFLGSRAYMHAEGLTGARGQFMPDSEHEVLTRKFNNFLNSRYRIEIFDAIYVPRINLPEHSKYCLRGFELEKLEHQLLPASLDKETDKELSSKERNTLLVLIAVMCDQANFDYTKRGIASAIEAATEQMGVRVSDDTIRKILKQIPLALESRKK